MFLNRIHLDPRCREVRRDLSDPYQLHSTLCRAFTLPGSKCPANEFLWRLEPETHHAGYQRVIVQSRKVPQWERIGVDGWLAEADPAIDLRDRLSLDTWQAGHRFRFRLRANPCVTRNGKRLGLLRLEDQEDWVSRKGERHGFSLPRAAYSGPADCRPRIAVQVSEEQMLRGSRRSGNTIRVFSVLYDGVLTVTDPAAFEDALRTGIGHAKVMGLGLLSVAPMT